MDKKKFLKQISAFAAGMLILGCAGSPKPGPAQTALGKLHSQPITADGNKEDWPRSAPQYKDSATDTKIWISNDAEQLCLLAEIKNPGVARQLIQGGLILSVETREKDAKPFSIQIKGHAPFGPHDGPGYDPDNGDPKDHKIPDPASMAQDRPPGPMPGVKPPDCLIVTYPFSSGPVTMSMTEARATGIALDLAETDHNTLIFEAVISLDAIFFNVPRIAGTVINIALSAQDRSFAMERWETLRSNKDRRPNGRHPGGEPHGHGSSNTKYAPGKPDDMKETKASDKVFRAAVEIILAGLSK